MAPGRPYQLSDANQIRDGPFNLRGRIVSVKYLFAILMWKYVRSCLRAYVPPCAHADCFTNM